MSYSLRFLGKGFELFKIQLVNLILQVVTLGLYYPWAKANTLQYLYSHTTLQDHPFAFTGTGKQMFKGFIKALILFAIIIVVYVIIAFQWSPIAGILILYLLLFLILPLAIHGSYRYRMANTRWKGIRFGYVGDRNELIKLFFSGLLLTIITVGIYGPWFYMKLRTYIIEHVRMGDAEFKYYGKGGEFFVMNLVGYILTIFTIGIYFFWWQRDVFRFFINNTRMYRKEQEIAFESKASAGGFFSLIFGNLLIILFTLGLGIPWAITRSLKFVADNIAIQGDISLDELEQQQAEFSDATGEDMADLLDFGFII
ncbi:MAG: DUF898 domain-containing protein [Sediminibacterium sp.]|nr:DUF898 domain-containing protein [Sediminibacterium sp.]